MKQHHTARQWLLILPLALSTFSYGATGPALVVHDGTAGLESDVVSNLSGKLTTAGYTVTANVGVPAGSLATYRQIWDVRFNNTTPLSAGDITAYVAYMNGGGSLFVMGENTGFMTRDNSIIALIQQAGGGTISVVNPGSDTQAVQAPFTGPTALSSVTFLASASTANAANGTAITRDGTNRASAIVYGPGNMTAAPTGSLLIVFDVNFLQASADSNLQTLTNNMIAYLAAPVVVAPPAGASGPIATPSMSEWAMILLAVGLMLVASRRLLAKDSPARTPTNFS